MKHCGLFLLTLALTGCFSGVAGRTSVCHPTNSGIYGCTNTNVVVAKSTPKKVKKEKVPQVPLDNPKHLAEAMEHIQHYCPMSFDDPEQTEVDHAYTAVVARQFTGQFKQTPDQDFVRQMRLNCWALAVYHYGSNPYYPPLHALSKDLVMIGADGQGNLILELKK